MNAVSITTNATEKRFGLIIVGDEILSGKHRDQHMDKVIDLLKARGLSLSWAHYLGDDRVQMIATLQRSFASGDVVFSTGGIGSTPDDHTRQAAAAALGVALRLHPRAEQSILERIRETTQGELSRADQTHRLKMGEYPVGADIIPNPYNKIPGFSIREHYFVPGFPVMAWPMLEWVLDTYYAAHFHRAPQIERSMLVFETAESRLTPLMEQIEQQFPGIKVFSLPSVGEASDGGKSARRHIELGVKGEAELVARAYPVLKAGVVAMNAPFEQEV